MELSKQSCDNHTKGRYLSLLWILLAVLVTPPVAALSQQDHETAASHSEAGHGEHHEESPLAIVWRWGNFLILFGGLGWYLRKPLREFLDSRSKAIEEGLASGRKAREEAFQKLSEIEARLTRLDKEIKDLKEHALMEAEEEKTRILAGARAEADKILDMARREIEGLKKSARLELKSQVAELAVKLAEEWLRASLTPEENKKMIQQFLQTLGATQN
jgi:F-type H+-transporting ATPase subunit b